MNTESMGSYRFSGGDAAQAQAELGTYFGPRFECHAKPANYGLDLWLSLSLGHGEDQCRWGARFTFDTGDTALDAAARDWRNTFATQDEFLKAVAREAAGMLMAGVARLIGGRHLVSMSR